MNPRAAGSNHYPWQREHVAWGRLAAFGLTGAFWALCMLAAWSSFTHH